MTRSARLHKDLFLMMKTRGDNDAPALVHFEVVLSESVETAEIYIWKQCFVAISFSNYGSDVCIIFLRFH